MRILDFSSFRFFCGCMCVGCGRQNIRKWLIFQWLMPICPRPPQPHWVLSVLFLGTDGVGRPSFHVFMSYWVIGEVSTGLYGWFLQEQEVVVGSIRWISDPIPVAECHSNTRQEKKMHGSMQLDLTIGSRAAKQFSSLWRGWHRWLGIKHVLLPGVVT